ncbi:MAG TPA: ABC transporter permease [Acidimicrobiia bacterium]|nr:ABC transporter permease [Acidimicrobiia bacterium]
MPDHSQVLLSNDAPVKNRRRRRFAPAALLSPGMIWLLLFFFVPLVSLFQKSLSSKPSRFAEPQFTWEWSNYSQAFSQYGEQFQRSFTYAGIATVIALCLAFPLAYVIAFRGGRYKNLWMGLVMVPFFTNFLIRTLAWKTLLGRDGPLLTHLVGGDASIPLFSESFQLLRTPAAVIGGLVYNFLPFMVLPLYVALEKIDPKLIDAARDLSANTFVAFRKIILPLAMPGIFAGSLLVFIPAAGDFVNTYYLGTTKTSMIGTVVQNQFLNQNSYPVAAALSFVFMLIVLVLFVAYSTVFDAEDLAG